MNYHYKSYDKNSNNWLQCLLKFIPIEIKNLSLGIDVNHCTYKNIDQLFNTLAPYLQRHGAAACYNNCTHSKRDE